MPILQAFLAEDKESMDVPAGMWVSLLENSDGTTQRCSPLPPHTRAASNEAQFPDQFSAQRNQRFHFAGVQLLDASLL